MYRHASPMAGKADRVTLRVAAREIERALRAAAGTATLDGGAPPLSSEAAVQARESLMRLKVLLRTNKKGTRCRPRSHSHTFRPAPTNHRACCWLRAAVIRVSVEGLAMSSLTSLPDVLQASHVHP